ncbi:MAG: sporulation initiation factor Spo0A C-terminal domain-containing protein [Clostridia bacterium]|nr:sporulation initiation factor Spo0A C-terminal domain-containing protein [Clostridia bacterium]
MTDTEMLLLALGFQPSYKGFAQLVDILHYERENNHYGHGLTKCVYPVIAKKHNTTASAVERNVRTAIVAACDKRQGILLNRFFSTISSDIPTNHEVISFLNTLLKSNDWDKTLLSLQKAIIIQNESMKILNDPNITK